MRRLKLTFHLLKNAVLFVLFPVVLVLSLSYNKLRETLKYVAT